ncbi:hypothetical protein [[Clostridium] colinum]|uniref:hypothetical protein n=1 Tax=[Clostridium] colinum TaxID=36835 RepID=UPI002024CA75|nr:hypothetical protein [[Clostridium] colinum]
MLEKLRIKITLIATLVVTIFAYLYNDDFLKTCYAIIITIVVFYFLGGFIEIFLKNQIEKLENNKINQDTENVEHLEIEEELEYDYVESEQEDDEINNISNE